MTIALTKTSTIKEISLDWFRREPRFAGATVIFALLILPTYVAMQLDERTYQDINIWIKPMKFTLAAAVYLGTLAWFAGWMKWETRSSAYYRWFSRVVIAATIYELAWVYGAAANGIGSHFNTGSALMGALYTAAGIFVMVMMLAAPVCGWAILRNHRLALDEGLRSGVVVSLFLTFVLTVVIASYLASQPSHFVGGNLSDAEGGSLFGWARDGGDLRAAHFFALHAMHFVPAFALAAIWLVGEAMRKWAVLVFAALYSVFTVYVFVEALMGRPFLGGLL